MSQLIKTFTALLAMVMLVAFVFGTHASGLQPAASHPGDGGSHVTRSSASCVTVCNAAILHKKDYISEHEHRDNDEPASPLYLQFQTNPLLSLQKQHTQESLIVLARDPPPGGLPAYIALAVSRT